MMSSSDGRRFAWIDAAAYAKPGRSEFAPAILYDPLMCGETRINIVFERKLDPSEYGLTLDGLIAKYPLPTTNQEPKER